MKPHPAQWYGIGEWPTLHGLSDFGFHHRLKRLRRPARTLCGLKVHPRAVWSGDHSAVQPRTCKRCVRCRPKPKGFRDHIAVTLFFGRRFGKTTEQAFALLRSRIEHKGLGAAGYEQAAKDAEAFTVEEYPEDIREAAGALARMLREGR